MKRISALLLLICAGCFEPDQDKQAVKNPENVTIKYVAGTNDGLRIYETKENIIVIWRGSVAVTRR